MFISNLLIALAVCFGMANIAASIVIMSALDRRNIKTNILVARLMIFRYLRQYREITIQESGRVGALYYIWIISINLAAAAAIIGILMRL